MKLPRGLDLSRLPPAGGSIWIGSDIEPGRFFEGEHVAMRIAPFVGAGLVSFLLVPLVGVPYTEWRVLAAAALIPALVAVVMLVPWEGLPRWAQALPVLAGYLAIALLRDTGGNNAAVFEPLLIIPIAFFALYGTRGMLAAGAVALAATMILPVVLIGGPGYNDSQAIRACMVVVIVVLTGGAVQALVNSMRRLTAESKAVLHTAQDAFVAVTEDMTIMEWNEAAERTFGWPRSEAIGRDVVETLVRPRDRKLTADLLQRFLETGEGPLEGARAEARAMHRDGTAIPLELTVSPIRIEGQWVFNMFMHDISARKRTRTALQQAEERFRRAFEENRVGMILITPAGQFMRVNDAFCKLLGYTAEDLVGSGFEEITHPDDVEASVTALKEIAAGERFGYRAEKRCLHSDGRFVWTAVNVSPIADERGELLHMIAQVEDISERKEREAKLTHQALHDPLTGLPNRVLFADRVRMASARRDTGSFGVIYLDLDTFKPINDTLGHSAGDQVLVEVSRRLEELLREGDTLARLGGDEFAILCEGTDEGAARMVALRVTEAFSQPFDIGGRQIHQAASVGVAVQPRDGRPGDLEAILRNADLAMYRAKAAGKSRYALFEGWMGEEKRDRREIARELRRAIDQGELSVHYQPEVDLQSDAVTGAEALVRWRHPGRGLLEPPEFMFAAEGTDLIVAIDDFVLRQACHEAARWRRELGDDRSFVISVNVSERRLAEPGLSNKIAEAIADARLPADSLCLEVAESAVMDRRGDVLRSLPDLEELGVRLLIDDFGVAISSFSALRRLPRLNAIKIDRSFIAGLGRSPEDAAGAAAIIGIAHGLKLTAIAEGVETAEQLATLRELDCDRAQGFYFARPQPPESFERMLESARHGALLA
jgi:diguanylate cyclase (GGDEF)-like protein/PAS domain S-box-containing protein